MVELIDTNVLLGRLPRQDVGHDGSPQALLDTMDRCGIAKALVGNVASWLHDPETGNRELLDLVHDQPRLSPVWVALPDTTNETPNVVERATQAGVQAIRLYPLDHGFALDGKDIAHTIAQAAAAGLTIYTSLAQTSWPAIESLARQHEELELVVQDLGYRTLRQAAGVLQRTSNVKVDTAYLAGHGALEWLAATYGPHRVVFGTGYPARDPGEAVTRLLWSELDDATVETIGRAAA
ncbi:amidohydrolase family protein [Tenggerimyces flavus]|uniref:Amidohydrolase family protein n=1 Tax=Tenggerimyces flavus TaxID=1708749 RepID=A0ABV7YBW0_9ACTN|nr:amidohydrolase family protein [Tenggerimyces flavus]MBM7786120.1 putative TIM-barrel fold metal-dependent hydrolase [Tenggerimyces flavus]